MNERKSIGKGLRFDIFRRDQFTCRYCGRRPPEVVLEVDHLVPIAQGGENSEPNLVTSCDECNRGKSAKSLVGAPPSADIDPAFLEIEQEAAEMRRYLRAKEGRDAALEEVVRELDIAWCEAAGTDWYPSALPHWIRIFGPEMVEKALLATAPKWRFGKFGTRLDAVKYIRGTLNVMARRENA